MILLLRTDKPQAEIYLADAEQVVAELKWQAHRELSETLLLKISELLNSNINKLEDIRGIVVYKGPGSFTGLRIGITTANTLAYGLKIPVVGGSSDDWIQDGLQMIQNASASSVVLPEYGAEPHITKQRK